MESASSGHGKRGEALTGTAASMQSIESTQHAKASKHSTKSARQAEAHGEWQAVTIATSQAAEAAQAATDRRATQDRGETTSYAVASEQTDWRTQLPGKQGRSEWRAVAVTGKQASQAAGGTQKPA